MCPAWTPLKSMGTMQDAWLSLFWLSNFISFSNWGHFVLRKPNIPPFLINFAQSVDSPMGIFVYSLVTTWNLPISLGLCRFLENLSKPSPSVSLVPIGVLNPFHSNSGLWFNAFWGDPFTQLSISLVPDFSQGWNFYRVSARLPYTRVPNFNHLQWMCQE